MVPMTAERDQGVKVFVRPDGWFGLKTAEPQDVAERDQGVTEPVECPICDAPPEPCVCGAHGERMGPHGYGCKSCVRERFAAWLDDAGAQRFCEGSGIRDGGAACPGCAACATAATTCPAFWDGQSVTGCVFCGGAAGAHRRLPELPPPEPIRGFRVVSVIDDTADPAPRSLILRDPR